MAAHQPATMIYTAEQKQKAVDRELSFRRRVFPRLVGQGRMTRSEAAEQIAIFEAISADYAKAAQGERLI